MAIADDDSVSLLLPDPKICHKGTCTTTFSSQNVSLLDWSVYTPSSPWWKTLRDFTFDGIAGAKCSKIF
jgi:hypothetical protein